MRRRAKNLITTVLTTTIILFVGCVAVEKISYKPSSEWIQKKQMIMGDHQKIIDDDFVITKSLEKRVSFWVDIYGHYSSDVKVIHDSSYPWIVYEVIDTKGMKSPNKFLSKRVKFYKHALKKLSQNKLSKDSLRLKELFDGHETYLKEAYKNIRYQTGQKNHMRAGIKRSMPYLDHMEEIFQAHNLPSELTRLPFVESSFNWKAHSKAGARGIWQFMIGTGKKFMKINRYVDERASPLKSTLAAAKLLKQNYRILKKEWPLAITAYNHGPSGVKKAARKVGTNDMGTIADNYSSKRFSFASANFYSSFLAALYVEKYKDIIFKDIDYKKTPRILVEKTKRRTRAKTLFKKTGLSKKDFISWNPDLKKALKKNYNIPRNFVYYKPLKNPGLAYNVSNEELTTDMD